MNAPPPRIGQLLRILFGVVGLLFMGVAFQETWARSRGQVLPGWGYVAGAEVLALVSLAGASRSWVCLFGEPASARALAGAFYKAQLGKYVPGAVWQAVGQVALSRRAGVSLARATLAFPVHALAQVAAGGTVGALLAWPGFGLPPALRILAAAGLVLVLPLRRSWMARVLGSLRRLSKDDADALPSQRAILRSYAWGIWTLGFAGSAFALLAFSLGAARPPAAAVPAFALAWTIGFLAVPFPSGIGVREAALIATVASPSGTAPVIAASVVHRLVTMAGELVMILATGSRTRSR